MIGTTIAHYVIKKRLGAGGMGEVYLAHDSKLDRPVALKILPTEFVSQPERLARFIREAKAASAVNHPNVAHIYEIGEENGVHFIVMEYIEGESLAARMGRIRIAFKEILSIARQMAEALLEAHKKKVIHRDIKPGNIMLTTSGRVKLVDFGLAKVHPQELELSTRLSTISQTDLGVVMGTLPYMSPEQLRGQPVDHRTDVFSFGVVLYELVTSKLPFTGNTAPELCDAILHNEPPAVHELNQRCPREFSRTVTKMLAKSPADRPPTAEHILAELDKVPAKTSGGPSVFRTRSVAFSIAALVLAIAAVSIWFLHRNSKMRWAREEALLQITQMIDEGKYSDALALGVEAEKYIPHDPLLKTFWTGMSSDINIQTSPDGAEVLISDYNSTKENWKSIGKTPLNNVRIPKGYFRMKIVKSGFPEIHGVIPRTFWEQKVDLNFSLKNYENAPAGMARIPGAKSDPNSQMDLETVPVQNDYWIDQYEVTNKDFQKFVESGGYVNKKYWKVPFIHDGRELTFEEAMTYFQDATGRPGPLDWEVGRFPPDQADHPVTGVSWYEAAAYAEFVGKELPSIYHWVHAAGADMNYAIIPLSNFASSGPHPVGSRRSMSPFGTYDMAGNVGEWCWNPSKDGKRVILGGSYLEPVYMFLEANTRTPFKRDKTVGFRCMKYSPSETQKQAYLAEYIDEERDYAKEKPVADETFQVLKTFYDYPKSDLNAKQESIEKHGSYVIKEKVSFTAAYGNERIIAYLFLPQNVSPPYQAVVYFPGSGAQYFSTIDSLLPMDYSDYGDFLVRSGRAFVYPIYKGTYERGGGPQSSKRTPDQLREWRIQCVKDVRRVVDYLVSRKDIDSQRLAYLGTSWGGRTGNIVGGVEDRFRLLIIEHGGFPARKRTPETDEINFAPHIHVPVLMINGTLDHVFPVETSQKPMFARLGTAPQDKLHYLIETGHTSPRKEIIKVVLDWLDKYLGSPNGARAF